LTTTEAAARLGIKPRAVRQHIARGNLAATAHDAGGGRVWYTISEEDLQQFEQTRRPRGRPRKEEVVMKYRVAYGQQNGGFHRPEHDPAKGYVHENHCGINCTTGQLVPSGDEEEGVLFISEHEAAAINIVLRAQQWSPRTNPSNISLDPEAWAVAVRYGFAQPGEREAIAAEIEAS
jgi:hypothetical protein